MIATGSWFWLWVILPAYFILGPFNISVTLHRLLTHKAFKTHDYLAKFLSYLTVYTTLGPTVTWVGLHRYHHTHPDTVTDTHSPYDTAKGRVTARKAFSAWTGIGWEIPQIPSKFVRDMLVVDYHKTILNHYFKIIFAGVFLLFLIDPMLPLYAYAIPSVMAFHGVSMINVLGHSRGYRNFETKDRSTNSWITQLLTLEGWHNNHHHNPAAWQMGEQWWELDPLSWIIRIIKK
jgi:stearoyl-CoA desaturase (delta-9 desaturase)